MNVLATPPQRVAPAATPLDLALLRRRVGELPALPQAVLQVTAILRREDSSVDDCAACIERDPAMTARTLRLANSAFYGVPGRVATMRDAIHILGRRSLGALLTTAAVSAQFDRRRCPGFDFGAFWRHALGSAIATQSLARELDADDELGFTAGLLHDIGRLALATYFPVELGAVLACARAAAAPLRDVERSTLGVDHAQVGAMIAAHWRFPGSVVQAILDHHAPVAPADAAAPVTLAELVHLADAMVHALDVSAAEDEAVPEIDAPTWSRLALGPAQCGRVFERTETGVAALCQALAI